MKLQNKKIIVTGGAGFIGSHLVDRLLDMGNRVAVIDNLSSGNKSNINKKAVFYKADISDFKKISGIFLAEKPDLVFHFAALINARVSMDNPQEDARINVLGTLNILESCCKCKVKKVIFASSAAVYGEPDSFPVSENSLKMPINPYGVNKLAGEGYLNFYSRSYSLPSLSLRFGNVYGPRQNSKGEAGVIAVFCDRMLSKKQSVIYGNGMQTRDFIFIDDIIEAVIAALEKDKTGIFNIAFGEDISINDIFRKLKQLTGSGLPEKYDKEIDVRPLKIVLDISKAVKEFGFRPRYKIDDGLKKTVDWFKSKL